MTGAPKLIAVRRLLDRCVFAAARSWRSALDVFWGVRFIGVTGSSGKTTTTRLIAAGLRVAGPVRGTDKLVYGLNHPRFAAQLILTTSPWHRFCVCEVGGARPGTLSQFVRVLRPHIGVVTHVAWDHYKAFHGLQATAVEKRTLVEALTVDGTAVLNADDPLVVAMGACTGARVITYGLSPEALVRGEEVACAWPQRLSLTVRHGADRVRLQTRLVGEHWAHAVLAALATAIAAGHSLEEAARGIERTEPTEGRSSVHTVDGITFIRDDWKAPLWTIPASLRVMEQARARRKIVILGTISDYPGDAGRKYRAVARQAVEAADKVIFVGKMAHCALRARRGPYADRIEAFDTLYALDRFLWTYLEAGDLVLLKGSIRADHLQRLVLSRATEIACWRPTCGRWIFCSSCRLRNSRFVPQIGTTTLAARLEPQC